MRMAQDVFEDALPHLLATLQFAVQHQAAVDVHVFFEAREHGCVAGQLDRRCAGLLPNIEPRPVVKQIRFAPLAIWPVEATGS